MAEGSIEFSGFIQCTAQCHNFMIHGLYDDRRAAQCAAFFLHLADGSMEVLKLTKLLYLSERLSYERYGEPLTGATPYALKDGPVLSEICDHLKNTAGLSETWLTWVAARTENELSLNHVIDNPPKELGALNRADFRVMNAIWGEFGSKSGPELAVYTRHHCPEWSDPGLHLRKIDPDTLLRKVGMKHEDIAKQLEHLCMMAKLSQAWTDKTTRQTSSAYPKKKTP